MNLSVAAAVFPVIFLGELPDKTMFASLLLGTRGHRRAVWLGAAAAFTVHVAIAVTVGGLLLTLLPGRVVQAVVAVMFIGGAAYVWREHRGRRDGAADTRTADTRTADTRTADTRPSHPGQRAVVEPPARGFRATLGAAFAVVFLAEWGDLTQILTADLAARYHQPLAVGVGALIALWCVAGLAVLASGLVTRLSMTLVRRVTAVILLGLGIASAVAAATG